MVKLQEGDIVKLVNYGTRGFGAKVGATATIGRARNVQYVEVTWDRDNCLVGRQHDGGYLPEHFELIGGPW